MGLQADPVAMEVSLLEEPDAGKPNVLLCEWRGQLIGDINTIILVSSGAEILNTNYIN